MTAQALALTMPAPQREPIPETWLTLDRVADLESYADGAGAISRREVQRRIAAGEYRAQDSDRRARNGRAVRLVALSSLSAQAQARYLAQLRDRAEGRAVLPIDHPSQPSNMSYPERLRGAAAPLTSEGTPDIAALRRAGRDTEADIYLQRLSAVSRALAALQAAPHGRKAEAWTRLHAELDVPARTLQRWTQQYQAGGAAALVPGYGAARGHYRRLPEGLQRAILASYRNQQRQSVAQIMRYTVRPWCATHGHIAPNRTTVSRFLDHEVLAAERAAFRLGRRNWEEQVMAKVERDPNALAVNDLWCADHRRFDVMVRMPDGRVIRPWLTLYVDIASAGFVGWCLRDRPNAQAVALALRAGMLRCGLPKSLYHDNGKEFVARRFGGKAARLTKLQIADPSDALLENADRWPALLPAKMDGNYGRALLAELGVERIIHALPYHSWSKPIESMFHAFHAAWENLMPGYCGNAPDRKPEKLKAELREGRLLTWQQFVEIFSRQVAEWNADHVCGERRKTPDQYYESARSEIRTVAVDRLDLLLLDSDNRKVPAQGIEVGGKRFLDEQLALHVGEYVSVAWDPDDLSAIVVRPARNPNLRLVVSPIPHADWFQYSEANQIVQRVQKLQRQRIRAVAVSDRQALVADYVDPTGANRLACANAQAQATLSDPERAERVEGESNGPLAAIRSAAAQEKKVRAAERAAARKARASVADQVIAQAQAEESYRKGEPAA